MDYPPATCSDHRTLRSSTAARAKPPKYRVQSGIAGRYGRLQLAGYGRHRGNRRETLDGGGTDKEHLTGKRPDRTDRHFGSGGHFLEQLQTWAGKDRAPLLRNSQYGHRSKAKHDVHHGAECDRRSEQTGFEYFRCIGQSGNWWKSGYSVRPRRSAPAVSPRLPLYRAAMEGGVELGLYPQKAQEGVLQTLLCGGDRLASNPTARTPETGGG